MYKKFVITLAAAAAGAAMLVVGRPGVEPSRGAAHQPGPDGRQHRPLRVPQPRSPRHGHDHRQLHPARAPAGGPNFPAFDDTVLYEIHVDNDGDAKEDLTYQFRFHTETRNPDTFLYNTGPITSLDDPNWNRPQTYSVTLVHARTGQSSDDHVLGTHLTTPPDNIGPRSTPNYDGAGGGGRPLAAGRHQGVRRPARRSVLRRPRDRSSTSPACVRSTRCT